MKKNCIENTDSPVHTSKSRDKSPGKRRLRGRTALAVSMALVLIVGLLTSGCGNKTGDAGAASVQAAEPASDSQEKDASSQAVTEDTQVKQSDAETETEPASKDEEAGKQEDASDEKKTASADTSGQLDSIAEQYASIQDKEQEAKGEADPEIKSSVETADASLASNPQYSAFSGGSLPFELVGTTSGNLLNFGEFGFYNDKVLYVNNKNLMIAGPGLENPSVVQEDVYGNLNVAGDLCFYTSADQTTIKACLLDGSASGEAVLFQTDERNKLKRMCLIGEWIYFATETGLYRFSISDTSSAQMVSNDVSTPALSLCTLQGKLICSGRDGSVLLMEPDGSNKQLVTDKKGYFISDGNALYLFPKTGKELYRIDFNGTSVRETQILDLNDSTGEYDFRLCSLNYADGWIYEVVNCEDVMLLSRQKADGSELVIIDSICEEPDSLVSMSVNNGFDYAYCFTIGRNGSGGMIEDHFPVDIVNIE